MKPLRFDMSRRDQWRTHGILSEFIEGDWRVVGVFSLAHDTFDILARELARSELIEVFTNDAAEPVPFNPA